MWTFLLDLLFYALIKSGRTPKGVAIALTTVIIGYAIVVIITKSDI